MSPQREKVGSKRRQLLKLRLEKNDLFDCREYWQYDVHKFFKVKKRQTHDFTIRCGNRRWKVHQAILCAHSEFFKIACTGGFEESITATLTFEEEDPDLIDKMLRFMYTLEYPERQGASGLVNDAKMYALAHMYGLDSLKEAVKLEFLDTDWPGVSESDKKLFLQIAKVAYESTPDDGDNKNLRSIISFETWQSRKRLFRNRDFQQYILKTSDYARDILKHSFPAL